VRHGTAACAARPPGDLVSERGEGAIAARPRHRWRRTVVIAALVSGLSIGGAVLGTVVLGRAGLPGRATAEGEVVVRVWRTMLALAGAITGIVVSFVLVALVEGWRGRHGPDPEQDHGDVRLEIAYTAIPLLVVAGVFGLSLDASADLDTAVPEDAVRVEVTGFQWGWRFAYEGGPTVVGASPDAPELVLPVDRVVAFDLESTDVVHSFFSPAFLTKLDAVPGRTNRMVVEPSRTGTFRGHCAEFCGLDHPRMGFSVRIVSEDEYAAWLDDGGRS